MASVSYRLIIRLYYDLQFQTKILRQSTIVNRYPGQAVLSVDSRSVVAAEARVSSRGSISKIMLGTIIIHILLCININ